MNSTELSMKNYLSFNQPKKAVRQAAILFTTLRVLEMTNFVCVISRAHSNKYGNNGEYEYCFWCCAARRIMYGNNGEYEYCLWCCAARSIKYGNNGEYEYCLWCCAARSIMCGNNGEYEYCLWCCASEERGAEQRLGDMQNTPKVNNRHTCTFVSR